MKALTLHQPWASLIAVGAKTIETRSWSVTYRGPLAIHAAKRDPALGLGVGDWTVTRGAYGWFMRPCSAPRAAQEKLFRPLPLGAIVATCTLVDVVPIVAENTGPRTVLPHFAIGGDCDGFLFPAEMPERGWYLPGDEPVDRTDQLAYGDFGPGRFVWLLDDVRPVPVPVPCRGYQRLWNWDDAALGAPVAS